MMLKFGQRICLMNGESSVVLIWQDQLLIFQKMNFVKDLVDMFSSFVLQVAKKGDNLYPPTR
jgi:hypothetical protein